MPYSTINFRHSMQRLLLSVLLGICMVINLAANTVLAQGVLYPTKISVLGVPEGDMLANLKLSIEPFQGSEKDNLDSVTSDFAYQKRIREAQQQIVQALKPFGYYRPLVKHQLNPAKPDNWQFNITLGKPVLVNDLDLLIEGPINDEKKFIDWRSAYPLPIGAVLNQPAYEQAKSELAKIGRQLGYFDAKFTHHTIEINSDRTEATIRIGYQSGPRHSYGPIVIQWENSPQVAPFQESLVRSYIKIESGQSFNENDLFSLQRSLSSSPLFQQVSVKPSIDKITALAVPIEINLETKKRHVYGMSAGFGTDTGPRATLKYENRRLNNSGHRFSSQLYLSEEKQNIYGNYRIPLPGATDDGFNLFLSQTIEDSDARDLSTLIAGVDITRNREQQQWSYGISYRDEQFTEGLVSQDINLLVPTASWHYLSADDLYSPTKGWKLSSTIRGAHEDLVSDLSFLQLSVEAKAVLPMQAGRFLTRLQLAGSIVQNAKTLPESLRFFAGGDNSVRGYAYESIGVLSASGDLKGGENRASMSIEYEYPLKNALAIAAFLDAGDAFDSNLNLKFGAGIGLRYRLPFGAFRVDLASGLDLEGRPLRVHLTFGTDL